MTKLLAVSILCAALGLGVLLGSSVASRGAHPTGETFVVRLDDRIRVLGVPVACRVVRVRQLGNRVALDCRRGGRLAATYGTLLTAREAALVDFESTHRARFVAVARHGGEARTCGKTS